MPFNIQGPELIIILIIALIVIGPGKLPEVGNALGKSIREFRKAASDVKESTSLEAGKSDAQPPTAPPPVVPASAGSGSASVPTAPPPVIDAPAAAAPEPVTAEPQPTAGDRVTS
jgi:TatA/E family protein of Tat protein translocase